MSPVHHRRARLPPRLRMGASGNGGRSTAGFGADAGSSFASADLSGAIRGESGNLSSRMARRTNAVTAAYSSSEKSIVGWSAPLRADSFRPLD
jgi:hypothetical protein